MAEHAHTTPVTLARRRHVRAAPGAMDRRTPAPTTFRLQLSRTESDGLPLVIDWRYGFGTLPGHPALPLAVDWTGIVTPDLRRRIERHVDLLIALLDALDGDAESDGCEDAIFDGTLVGCGEQPGWSEDFEPDTDAEAGEAGDPDSGWLEPADGHGLRGSLVVA